MWGRSQKRGGIFKTEEKEREKKEVKTEISEYMAESQDCRKSCPVGSFQGWGGQINFKHRNTKYCILSWLQCYDTHLLHHLIPSAESNSPYSTVWRCLKNKVLEPERAVGLIHCSTFSIPLAPRANFLTSCSFLS